MAYFDGCKTCWNGMLSMWNVSQFIQKHSLSSLHAEVLGWFVNGDNWSSPKCAQAKNRQNSNCSETVQIAFIRRNKCGDMWETIWMCWKIGFWPLSRRLIGSIWRLIDAILITFSTSDTKTKVIFEFLTIFWVRITCFHAHWRNFIFWPPNALTFDSKKIWFQFDTLHLQRWQKIV